MPVHNQQHSCRVNPDIEIFYDAEKFVGWWWKVRAPNGQLLNSYKVTFCPACGWSPECNDKRKRLLSCSDDD